MSDDATKNLIIRFTTDALPAQRNIQNFAQISGAALLQLGQNADRSSNALQDLAGKADALQSFTSSIPLIGGQVSKALSLISAAAREAEQDIAGLVKISQDAAKAGVGTSFFQAYIAQAKSLGVETSTLVDELNKVAEAGKQSIGRVGDDDEGKSDALKQLQEHVQAGNLGQNAISSFTGAQDGEARARVMLDLLDQLDQKGAKLAEYDLAKSFFGDSFEERLRAGVDAVGDMRAALDNMSSTAGGVQIIPAEQIERAKIMQQEINDLNQRLSTVTAPTANTINGIFQSIDETLISGEALIIHYVEELTEFINKWMGVGNAVAYVNTKILDLANYMRNLAGMKPLNIVTTPNADGSTSTGVSTSDPYGDKEKAARAALAAKMGAAPAPVARPGDGTQPDTSPYGSLVGVPAAPPKVAAPQDTSKKLPATNTPASSDDDSNDKVQNYIDQLKKVQMEEEAETKTLGLSNKAKDEAVNLAKAQALADDENRTLTAAETAEIKQRTDAYADAKLKIDQFTRSQEQAKEQTQFFGQTFETAIEGMAVQGDKLVDVLKQVAQAIESALLKAAILGEGPLAGLFGTAAPVGATGAAAVGGLAGMITKGFGSGGLFSGLFSGFSGFHADGGSIPNGGWGIAGEAGPEIIVGPASVVPMKSMQAGAGRNASFTNAATYNITPADGVTPGQLATVIDRNNRDMQRNFGDILSNWSRRFG